MANTNPALRFAPAPSIYNSAKLSAQINSPKPAWSNGHVSSKTEPQRSTQWTGDVTIFPLSATEQRGLAVPSGEEDLLVPVWWFPELVSSDPGREVVKLHDVLEVEVGHSLILWKSKV